ncbi:MAG TPA: PAS domain S-box protein, partial [Rubrobacteraceae bacterium]|nr:PAS domain S-box protein [Rubrobacteraceae bacterium]
MLAEEERTDATGEPFEVEYRVIAGDGRVVWVRDHAVLVRDEDGRPLYWQGVQFDITDQKRTEEALRESEERFRATFEQVAVGMAHVDLTGRWLHVNEKLLQIVGYEREELLGLTFQDITHPDDLDADLDHLRRLLAGEIDTYSMEKRYFRKDGSVVWIELTVSLVKDPSGQPGYFISVIEDIAGRKRSEDEQRLLAEAGEVLASSLDYRTTLSGVARLAVPSLADWCAVDVVGEDGSVGRLAVVHEEPRKVALAHQLQERYPPDPDAAGGVLQVLRSGRPEFYPEITDEMIEAAARDEEHLELIRELGFTSMIIVPMVARGRTLGVITLVSAESGWRYTPGDLALAEELARRAALAVDNARLYQEAIKEIAERRRAEEELRRSRDQLDIILRGVADGVIAQDSDGQVFYSNDTAARMSGYPSAEAFVEAPAQEVMSKFELLDAEGRPFPLERLPGRMALQGEEVTEVIRFRIIATGEERWSVVSATPIFDEEGGTRMAVSILRDITEQRRAEEERARLASIVESSEDAIISKTLDGTITSWNRGAQKIYGYSAQEAVGQHITFIVPPGRPDEIPKILEKLRRGEKIENHDTVRVTKDGRLLDISLTVSPIRDSEGTVVGASTIARDITERRLTEQRVLEAREAERSR